ncbi:MAG: hypothetical protein WC325_11650 [Candidatus Bathyarchaeia archaeon]|jgi:hypothetical protein
MPTVKQNTLYIKAKGGEPVAFLQIIKFNSRQNPNKFSIDLPEWWASLLGYKTVVADTCDAVILAFKESKKKFEEMTCSKRKVILYKFLSSAMLYKLTNGKFVAGREPHDSDGAIEKCLFRTKGGDYPGSMDSADGTGLTFWYRVCYEVTSSFESYTSYVSLDDVKITDSRSTEKKVIEWTQQREDFFHQFEFEITKMIVQMHNFLYSEPEKVAQLIDTYKTASALPDLTNADA